MDNYAPYFCRLYCELRSATNSVADRVQWLLCSLLPLKLQREKHYFPQRQSNWLSSASAFSDSIGVACNRLLIQPRPAALCVSSHLTMEQITRSL